MEVYIKIIDLYIYLYQTIDSFITNKLHNIFFILGATYT